MKFLNHLQKILLSTRHYSTMVKYLNQNEAANIDLELFKTYRYSVDQLMELAGLSCAVAITKCYQQDFKSKNILICCGPGNNGGDGLVCARHLALFGYKPQLYYPKKTNKPLYENLLHQCLNTNVKLLCGLPEQDEIERDISLIVDAIFGFSFRPPVREEFIPVIKMMQTTKIPIASIDVPSGWGVETGPGDGGIKPELLISLTAPKMCAKYFTGRYHYLGGRFIPPDLEKRYKLCLPQYKGTDCVINLK